MTKFKFELSWLNFVLILSAFITALNFVLFKYLFANLSAEQFFLKPIFIIIHFALWMMIFSLLNYKYTAKFMAIFFIIVTSLSVYFMENFGVIIDYEMIRNVAKTDAKEVLDLINIKISLWIVVTAILPSVLIYFVKINYPNSFKEAIFWRFGTFFAALSVILILFLPLTKTLVPFFRVNKNARVYNAPLYQIYSTIKFLKLEYGDKKELKAIAQDAKISPNFSKNSQKELLVFIVGETARAANFSLGGYSKNLTNPTLPGEKVIYFNNFHACGTSTAKSVPCMFSSSKQSEHSASEYQENVLDILQRLNIKTTWIDNNSGGCQGVCDRLINKRLYQNEFDGFLIDEVRRELKNLEDKNAIIIHMQGSHGPAYYKRYPKEWQKFTPTCDTNELSKCTQEELINTYDNTIAYTDYVVEEIIDFVKLKKDVKSVVIYVSDHGESLGENGIYLHAMPYFLAPQEQIHIPFVFWSNDEKLNSLAQNYKDLHLSHDNIFHSFLGFFGIQSEIYKKNLDIFNENLR